MRDFFAFIYESVLGIPHLRGQYVSEFFQLLYVDGGYVTLGLLFIVIPLIFGALFYFLIKYPYLKFWHWSIVCIVIGLITLAATRNIGFNMLIGSPTASEPGYRATVNEMLLYFSFYNALLSIVFFALFSLVYKQVSKSQAHLPF